MKTQRMDPQDAEAFPLVLWQNMLVALKAFASERVAELKPNHEDGNEAIAKIDESDERNEMLAIV